MEKGRNGRGRIAFQKIVSRENRTCAAGACTDSKTPPASTNTCPEACKTNVENKNYLLFPTAASPTSKSLNRWS